MGWNLAIIVALAGCSRTGLEGNGGDVEIDVVVDTGFDIPDAIADGVPDLPPDVSPDVVPDTALDTRPDPPPDVWPDTGLDTGLDTRPDPPPDIWPDTPPEVVDVYPDVPPDLPWDRPPDIVPDWVDGGHDGPVGGLVGDACRRPWECDGVPGSGRTCLRDLFGYMTFPGGYCSASCTAGWECGPGGTCVSLYGMGNYCLKYCSTPFDCRISEGYECTTVDTGSPTVCLPPTGSPDGGPVDY